MKLPVLCSQVVAVAMIRASALETVGAYCEQEGVCSPSASDNDYMICASQYWQSVPAEGYICSSGIILPDVLDTSSVLSLTQSPSSTVSSGLRYTSLSSATASPLLQSSQSAALSIDSVSGYSPKTSTLDRPLSTRTTVLPRYTSSGIVSDTGLSVEVTPTVDIFGIKSYVRGGKMASVYDANSASFFRCAKIAYPDDGMYVAFWTPFSASLDASHQSQPAPINCGDYIEFANPLTGTSATAVVIDRCSSCVGIDNVSGDSTIGNFTPNGATVDLSRNLWNHIFENAPNDVYDIQYPGIALQGTDATPSSLAD